MAKAQSNFKRFFRQGDLWLVIGVFATILVLILPIPPLALDMFLAISIGMSLLILLIILYVVEPADFITPPGRSTSLSLDSRNPPGFSMAATFSSARFCSRAL